MPTVYLENLLVDKAYERIILHQGYNPRIIDTATHKDVWQTIKPDEFSSKILNYLTYPETIWTHVYENQITRFSQSLLANLLTLGVPVLLSDLKIQVQQFAAQHKEKYGIAYSELDLKKALKELENTFITITKDSQDQFIVDYANPSIQDFLVAYFREAADHLNDVLSSARFFTQFFKIFIERHRDLPSWADDESKKIIYNKEQLALVIERLIKNFDEFEASTILKTYTHYYSGTVWRKLGLSIYSKLNRIKEFFPLSHYPQLKEFILERFRTNIYAENLTDEDFDDYMDLYEEFEDDCEYEPGRLISTLGKDLSSIKQLKEFDRLEMYISSEFDDFTLKNEGFRKKLESVIALESREPDDYDLDDVLSDVTSLGEKFNLDIYKYKEMIQEKIEQYEARQRSDEYWAKENPSKPALVKNDDHVIESLFRSLVSDQITGRV